MKEKDKKYVLEALEINEEQFNELKEKILAMDEEEKEIFIKDLTKNMPGRSAYEVQKILTYRLD